jgi:hypothetical protein
MKSRGETVLARESGPHHNSRTKVISAPLATSRLRLNAVNPTERRTKLVTNEPVVEPAHRHSAKALY